MIFENKLQKDLNVMANRTNEKFWNLLCLENASDILSGKVVPTGEDLKLYEDYLMYYLFESKIICNFNDIVELATNGEIDCLKSEYYFCNNLIEYVNSGV